MSVSPRQAEYEQRLERAKADRDRKRSQKITARHKREAKPSTSKTVPTDYRAAREQWYTMPWLQMCEVCGVRPATQAHHIIREQTLRRWAGEHGYDFQAARFDVRNRLWVDDACHGAHTNASRRISLSSLPAAAFHFARAVGLEWALDQDYEPAP